MLSRKVGIHLQVYAVSESGRPQSELNQYVPCQYYNWIFKEVGCKGLERNPKA